MRIYTMKTIAKATVARIKSDTVWNMRDLANLFRRSRGTLYYIKEQFRYRKEEEFVARHKAEVEEVGGLYIRALNHIKDGDPTPNLYRLSVCCGPIAGHAY